MSRKKHQCQYKLRHLTGYLTRADRADNEISHTLRPSVLFFSLLFLLQSPNVAKTGALSEGETVRAYLLIMDALPAFFRGRFLPR